MISPLLISRPVFVTGAGGLIGSAVCRLLTDQGAPVRALLAPKESDENLRGLEGIEIMRGDVRDGEALVRLLAGCGACIHAAALNRLWHRPHRDFYDINVSGTDHACRAAEAAGATRFVFVSSCEVMGPARPGAPADERRPLDGRRVRGHYEQSKLLAERLVSRRAASGFPAVILRPTAAMGPGDIHGTPPGRLVQALLGSEIPAFYDAGINIVDARDVAAAIVAALGGEGCGGIYIVGGHNLRLSDLFGVIERTCGIVAPPRRVGYRAAWMAASLRWALSLLTREDPGITVSGIQTLKHPWHFDSSKAMRELGLVPRPLAETVRETIAWHRDRSEEPWTAS